MKHPELIKNLGKIRKKERGQYYGLFQCPFCPNTFTARISRVVNEITTSCGCRKKKNFVEHAERRVRWKCTSQALARLEGERCQGADKKYLCKKYGIRPSEYPTAVRLAQEAYSKPVSPTRRVVASEANAVATVPSAPSVAMPQQTIIVQGDYNSVTNYKQDKLLRDVPYEQTEEGYWAQGEYLRVTGQMPADGFDLRAWKQMQRAN